MTQEQFERELNYGVKAHIARKLLAIGLITEQEFRKLLIKYEKQHCPLIGGYISSINAK
jgi:hypothetical protein